MISVKNYFIESSKLDFDKDYLWSVFECSLKALVVVISQLSMYQSCPELSHHSVSITSALSQLRLSFSTLFV